VNLHPYQQVAVEHLHRHPRSALFLDMGLGKTATTLRALTPDHLPALVTAPKRVAENVWGTEAQIWRPDLKVDIAMGSPGNRDWVLKSNADVVVIGRDVLKDALPYAGRFRTFILDELSGFKTRNTTRWKTARKIVKDMEHVWGLTGTPSPNGLMDLWAQIFLLDGGARLGKTLTEFRARWFVPDQTIFQAGRSIVISYALRPGAAESIHAKLEDICLSMDGEGRIPLPDVTYNKVLVPMLPPVKKMYKQLKDELVVDLEVLGGEIHSAGNAAILSNKLSQVSAGFLYVDDADVRDGQYTVIHQEKVAAVKEIVEGTGSPVLVFYRYLPERELLRAALPEAHLIDEPNVIERWNAGQVPVLLAHPASVGHGLNLQHGGHTVVWAGLTWSLEEWLQGNKRVARQGQRHPVVIHLLVSPGTVDEAIVRRLTEKTSVQEALLEHLESIL
jgi:SNF2 family DNA or RNA helicase